MSSTADYHRLICCAAQSSVCHVGSRHACAYLNQMPMPLGGCSMRLSRMTTCLAPSILSAGIEVSERIQTRSTTV